MKLSRRYMVVAAAAACALATGLAQAQSYPTKAITVVVSYPPGGDTDAMARLFSEKLSTRLKQPVVVENKPGAGGTIGNSYVSRAPADGYTLLFTPNPFTTAPMVMKLPAASSYDALNGFAPVIHTADQAVLLVANPSASVKTVAEMVALAKTGKPLSYGSPGAGSPMHIGAEWLNRSAGIKIQHVPYRGVGPAVVDVLAGHIPFAYVTLGPVAQHISSGKLLALALTDPKRSSLLPNVPTLSELGYKDVAAGAWNGFFAPKGTPPDIIRTLNGHLNEIIKMPDVVEKMAAFGAVPVGGPPADLAKLNAADFQRLGKVIQELGIVAE